MFWRRTPLSRPSLLEMRPRYTGDDLPESEDARELVRGALAGEPALLQLLVEKLSPVISRRVTVTLWQRNRGDRNPTQDVADIVQDVFVSLFQGNGKALRAWDPARGMSLESFVGLLAKHQTISILRNGRTSPWRDDATESADLDGIASASHPPDALVSSRELLRQVLDRLSDRLSPRGLELFHRMVVEEEPLESLAARMGLTREALYQWRSRFSRLARQLASEMDSAPAMSETASSPRMVKEEAPHT
jgi:DNA-directed RNA polymerase specialized sigma24 family protein